MPDFPSLQWFEVLRDAATADPEWEHFGQIDCSMGVAVGERTFKIVFEGFDIPEIAEITGDEQAADLDFTLVQPADRWREMLENIQANGKADLQHTLNTLDLESPDEFARGDDYARRDLFYRFNQTLQDFFDFSSKFETTFA